MSKVDNFLNSTGWKITSILIIIGLVAWVVLLYKNFVFRTEKIQNIPDNSKAYLVKIEYLNKEIQGKERVVDSLGNAIKLRDEKILKYDKELAKFKTLKNEKHTVISDYDADRVDSAFTAEGFHPYKVKSVK